MADRLGLTKRPRARGERTSGDGRFTPQDRKTLRLAALAGGLVLALVAGFGLGRAVGVDSPAANAPMGDMSGGLSGHAHAPGHAHGGVTSGDNSGDNVVGGLAVSSGGYTFVPASTTMQAGGSATFSFRIVGPDRRPVTNFAIVHDKPMHLIVVRSDLSGYQHLHPTMAADGTWQVGLTLPAAGPWRAYTDFAVLDVTGARVPVKLGVNLTVAGEFAPTPIPAAARDSTVDAYTVTYEGTPQVGTMQPLVFRVSRSGAPAPNLERYLGAYGHLIVLREGDLGYIHVHPEDQLFRGAAKFWLAAPSPGRYRMFFDYQVEGKVRTATYTVVVSA